MDEELERKIDSAMLDMEQQTSDPERFARCWRFLAQHSGWPYDLYIPEFLALFLEAGHPVTFALTPADLVPLLQAEDPMVREIAIAAAGEIGRRARQKD